MRCHRPRLSFHGRLSRNRIVRGAAPPEVSEPLSIRSKTSASAAVSGGRLVETGSPVPGSVIWNFCVVVATAASAREGGNTLLLVIAYSINAIAHCRLLPIRIIESRYETVGSSALSSEIGRA